MSREFHKPHRLEPVSESLVCGICRVANCKHALKESDRPRPGHQQGQDPVEFLPFVDHRHYTKMNAYPIDRRFVYKEYAENYQKARETWRYADNFSYDGPQFVLLSPTLAALNQEQSASAEIEFRTPTAFNDALRRIHFGFDNMWNSREPVFVITDEGEAKIWWQAKGVPLSILKPPEKCRFLTDAISPQLFLDRLIEMLGMPPEEWPLKQPGDASVRWCVMLTRNNQDQVLFRVLASGRLQVAYNGSTLGMYDIVQLLQLLIGPPGEELYVDKAEGLENVAVADRRGPEDLMAFVPGIGPVPARYE